MNEPPRIKAALVDFRLSIDEATEIRLLRAEDADAVFETTNRNRAFLAPWMGWIDHTTDSSDTHAFLRAAEREARDHTSFKAGIWQGRELVGAIDLHDIDWVNGRAQIGYWLDEGHTGKGIMTSAARLLTEYAFEALDLHRIEIRVATENHASRRIPERLGFTLEGILRDAQCIRGRFHDHALYALIRDDAGT